MLTFPECSAELSINHGNIVANPQPTANISVFHVKVFRPQMIIILQQPWNIARRWVGRPLQLNETLAYMAALIRENPNITVREIANHLKFADNKSVYYWLSKGNYHGIGEFKRAVLKEHADSLEGFSVIQNGESRFLVKVPVRSWSQRKNDMPQNWVYLFYHAPNPEGLFAMSVETNEFAPWFIHGDLIIVNTTIGKNNSCWVLLKKGRSYLIGRREANHRILNANTLAPISRAGLAEVGSIIQLWRSWPQS